MDKVIGIGDIHGRSVWKLIVEKNKDADRIVFVGDYLDSRYGFTVVEQLHNLKEIIEYKKANPDKVTLGIGNHDLHYFAAIGYNGTSGYQGNAAALNYTQVLEENKDLFKMCHLVDFGDDYMKPILFSHAGISPIWLNRHGWHEKQNIDEFINDLWKHKPQAFNFDGLDSSGDDECQTPVWIRPRSLVLATQESELKDYIQIVGHTSMKAINLDNLEKGYGFIDTLDAGQYLIIEDGKFSVGSTK